MALSIGTPAMGSGARYSGYVGPRAAAAPQAPSGSYRPVSTVAGLSQPSGPSDSDIMGNALLGMAGSGVRDVSNALEGTGSWLDVGADALGVLSSPAFYGTPLSPSVVSELGKAGLDYFSDSGNVGGHLENAAWGAGANVAGQVLGEMGVPSIVASPLIGGTVGGFRAANAFSDLNPNNVTFGGVNPFTSGATEAGLTGAGRGALGSLVNTGLAAINPLAAVAGMLLGVGDKVGNAVFGNPNSAGMTEMFNQLAQMGITDPEAQKEAFFAALGGGQDYANEIFAQSNQPAWSNFANDWYGDAGYVDPSFDFGQASGVPGDFNFVGPIDIGGDFGNIGGGFDIGSYGDWNFGGGGFDTGGFDW